MSFRIIRNDITRVKADAIVNTANPKPVIGSGTDSAIYQAAGKSELLAARKKIGSMQPGQAEETPAFALSAKYILHTVGPAWVDGKHGEKDILHSCYANSLLLAEQLHCESIAFPLIATGVYGFPKDEALQIALSEIGKFLLTHEMSVSLVVFDRKAFQLSAALVDGIEEYIDEHEVKALRETEYESEDRRYGARAAEERKELARRLRQNASALPETQAEAEDECEKDHASLFPAEAFDASGRALDDFVSHTGDTFQQRLLHLIKESGLDDVTVYKRANVDRRVFSRMQCKADYKPKKKTAVAYSIALRLDMPTMLDLLSRAEIAFSPSNKFDLIITYFVTNGNYDIFEINAALFKYGQPILGK